MQSIEKKLLPSEKKTSPTVFTDNTLGIGENGIQKEEDISLYAAPPGENGNARKVSPDDLPALSLNEKDRIAYLILSVSGILIHKKKVFPFNFSDP